MEALEDAYAYVYKEKKKVKQSRDTPWRRLGGEEV
jgi:hypothetical protein